MNPISLMSLSQNTEPQNAGIYFENQNTNQSNRKECADRRSSESEMKVNEELCNAFIERTNILGYLKNQCCILMFGVSGAGKSSTINHLFGMKVKEKFAETASDVSETQETTEYKCLSEDEDITLTFIDTPGYGDTNGHTQDACNLRTISKFFQLPEYKGMYPNLILLTFKATENRYDRKGSQFVKSLKCLKQMNIVNQKYQNVVTVITHCCSISPNYVRNNPKWVEKMENLKLTVKQLVYLYLGVDSPAVIIENEFEEEGLERQVEKDVVSEFTTLPNGEKQPLNLFLACLELFQRNGDICGGKHFAHCFVDGGNMKIENGRKMPPSNAMAESLDDEERKLVDIILEREEANVDFQFPDFNKAIDFMQQENLSLKEKVEIQEIETHIRRTEKQYATMSTLNYYMKQEISETGMKFLKTVMCIEEKVTSIEQINTIKHGFCLSKEEFSSCEIFDMHSIEVKYLLKVPNQYKIEKMISPADQCVRFEIPESQKYLKRLYENNSVVRIRSPTGIEREKCEITELRLFRLKFDDNVGEIKWTPEFKEAVVKLPPYKASTKKNYEDFFNKFGTTFISEAYVGGYIKNCEGIEWKGGDPIFHKDEDFQSPDHLFKWKLSILSNPVLLLNDLHLKSISEAVKVIDSSKYGDVQKALKTFLVYEQVIQLNPETTTVNKEPLTRKSAAADYTYLGVLAGGIAAVFFILRRL